MSIDDTDVLARLRTGADTVEEHRFDVDKVLAASRRALRRRRSWQAAGACTMAAAVAFSLALAGPVPVPGMGELTVPGGAQLRELVGLDQTHRDIPTDPGSSASLMPGGGAPRVTVPENAKLPTYD